MRRRGRVRILGSGARCPDSVAASAGAGEVHALVHAALQWSQREAIEPDEFLLAPDGFGAHVINDAAAIALSRLGIAGVLADEVHPRWQESLLHAGVPVCSLVGLSASTREGDDVIVDFSTGTIENVSQHRVFVGQALTRTELGLVRDRPAWAWYDVPVAPRPDPDVWIPPN